jgi:hypothetical protein
MKLLILIPSIFFSAVAFAQPIVSVQTGNKADTVVILPQTTITLTGTATQINAGHPILDTTWTRLSGPAATITSPANRMTTTVTGLTAGTYVFTLTATDKSNSTSANLTIKVLPSLPSTLAIKLASFNVTANDAGVLFTWTTVTETNNASFIIQKSTNNADFVDIATVASQAPGGNSSTPLTYTYPLVGKIVNAGLVNILTVVLLLSGLSRIGKLRKIGKGLAIASVCIVFFSCSKSVTTPVKTSSSKTEYRLKIVDLDGHATYSPVKVI